MKEVMEYEWSDNQLNELADKVTNRLMSAQEKKRKKIRDNAYHNTGLLLRKYILLKKHCEIVDQEVAEEFMSMWNDWRFSLDSLLEHKAKTAKLMKHVDYALEVMKAEDERAYDVIYMKYLLPRGFTDEFIASKYGVDRTTVGRWLKSGQQQLSVILFGIDVVVDCF